MSGNRVFVDEGYLVVEPKGLDRVWSFTRRLRIPLEQVTHASFDPHLIEGPTGWRGPGLHIPGKVSGTFHSGGERQFWNVTDRDRTILISLKAPSRFEHLVLTVDDPIETVDAINAARRSRRLRPPGPSAGW